MRMRLLAAALALGLGLAANLATATPVTYVFTGNFGTVEQGCWMRAGPDVCDTPLFGYFTIDDQPVEADDHYASYFGSGGPYGMFLTVGGQTGWNSAVGLELFHNSTRTAYELNDLVLFHTGTSITGGCSPSVPCTYPDHLLTFASWWLTGSGAAFNGPPRFPPMPDPSDFFQGSRDNVCSLAMEGCYITVGQSTVNPRSIYDWTFYRSPVVIPIPVPEPSTLALLGLGLAGLAAARRGRRP